MSQQESAALLRPDRGVFDFNVVDNFAADYLTTYYCQPPTQDEQAVLAFLSRQYPKIPAQPCAIEIGCGPTVHHVLPLAPFVSEIHMADYLADNLELVRRWRDGERGAHSWHRYTSLALALEGRSPSAANVQQREADTRRKITRLLACDLKSETPLGMIRQYPVVGSFYCAENIGITRDEWARMMRRLADLVAPGGYLFLSALRETTFYVVQTSDGITRQLPCASLTEDDFAGLLPALGFDPRQSVVESQRLTGQEGEGVNGVILVAARKRAPV